MNIVFFGASVTQQIYNSGYVIQFKNIIEENNLNELQIIQKGFGSMHLTDAGICKINEIISYCPNYIFIDWFSTGYVEINANNLYKYLDTIVRKLMLINSNICFLLFDRTDMCENRLIMYNLIIDYANKYNTNYIKLYNNLNVKELLRDTVHTNDKGSKFYSSVIYDYFINNMFNKGNNYESIPSENEFSNIKTLKLDMKVTDKIIMLGNFKIIGINQLIGNFSGIVQITRNEVDISFFNIWDQWCHYERNNIKMSFDWSNKIEIKITQNEFDTSLCDKNVDFKLHVKYMQINEIYYLGELNIE